MDEDFIKLSNCIDECMKAIRQLDELDRKAEIARLKKALQRESDKISREMGISPKKGVLLRRCECSGNLRVMKKK